MRHKRLQNFPKGAPKQLADPMRVILEVAQGRSCSRKVMSRRGASNSSSRRLLNSQSSLHLNGPQASAPTIGMPPDRHQALADHLPGSATLVSVSAAADTK